MNAKSSTEDEFYLVLLVDARHLDYSHMRSLLKTIVKHPSDGSKNADVGHAWVYLEGVKDGKKVVIEGGHSGELGRMQPKYFDGVMDLMERGDQNPIRYLWATQLDGFFQEGSGGHTPTFAVKVTLTEEQFNKIFDYITSYHYKKYSLVRRQCSLFVAEIAALAHLFLEHKITIEIQPQIQIKGRAYLFWTDPSYSTLTISSPDLLEKSLMKVVEEGRGENTLDWYLKTHPKSLQERFQSCQEALYYLPRRLRRLLLIL